MIKFTARGQQFDIPHSYIIENIKENVLIRNLAFLPENMTGKIDGSIFIDINPVYLHDILNYVYKKGYMANDSIVNNSLRRELCYISAIDEYEPDWMFCPLHEDKNSEFDATSIPTCDENDMFMLDSMDAIINVNTFDGKKIILPYSVVMLWKDSFFKDIILGANYKYLINKTCEFIDVWIDINYEVCNHLISIMRDGISAHHFLINKDAQFIKYILYYKIYEQLELNMLFNRIKRMTVMDTEKKKLENDHQACYNSKLKIKYMSVDTVNKTTYCFTDEEKNNEIFEEFKNNWRGGEEKIGQFHVVKDVHFTRFFDDIKKNRMVKKKNTVFVDTRNSYDETLWTYNISKKEMELIENYYYRYLMGYIN